MEKKQASIIQGKKANESDESVKKRREVKGSPTPPSGGGEVGGRSGYEYVACPHCGAINYVWDDDYEYIRYRCWNCGGIFIV